MLKPPDKTLKVLILSPKSFEIRLNCRGPVQKVHTPGLAVPRMTMPEEIGNLGGLGLVELRISFYDNPGPLSGSRVLVTNGTQIV